MNPLQKFEFWYKKAVRAKEISPDAMALASVSKNGKPSVRFILFKGIRENGVSFFTNYKSRKASDFSENSYAALTVFWPKIYLQVRLEGKIKKLSAAESDKYWKTRPRQSQIGAWSSPQSQTIVSRRALEQTFKLLELKFAGREIPRPPHWGGYTLIPSRIEFWTGQKFRLHERELFTRRKNRWVREILAP
ncbi:MAG: Pyridoxine/pyridoxamine 5-phosphate oxidase [Bacteriovoracaceae bacterium]|nr:Pyridoxine/pyridoxamine 5-phosphate oxidase [Bacteriovoracaceae bacterium]